MASSPATRGRRHHVAPAGVVDRNVGREALCVVERGYRGNEFRSFQVRVLRDEFAKLGHGARSGETGQEAVP